MADTTEDTKAMADTKQEEDRVEVTPNGKVTAQSEAQAEAVKPNGEAQKDATTEATDEKQDDTEKKVDAEKQDNAPSKDETEKSEASGSKSPDQKRKEPSVSMSAHDRQDCTFCVNEYSLEMMANILRQTPPQHPHQNSLR